MHVHEVTLHDLNVLHDGADLTGPLRLELRATPRFIARYNALRDQIARLDLAAEDEQTFEGAFQANAEGKFYWSDIVICLIVFHRRTPFRTWGRGER